MNIFILDLNNEFNARYHTDKHVVKMILEHVQLMSTAVRLSGINAGYKATHINHPCSKWARDSLANYNFLYLLTCSLNEEYRYRFKHALNHKSYNMMLTLPKPNLPNKGLTPFAQAMPPQYRNKDAVLAYRNYYVAEKQHLFKWSNRTTPSFITRSCQ